jgi:hypothetical protein
MSVSCVALSHSGPCALFIQTRTLVRCEAMITQLVFEHALRIRIKAEGAEVKPSSGGSTTEDSDSNTTPVEQEDASVSGDENVSHEGTLQASSASIKSTTSSKAKAKGKTPETKDEPPESVDASNLVGKITNLVTTDLGDFHFLVSSLTVTHQL